MQPVSDGLGCVSPPTALATGIKFVPGMPEAEVSPTVKGAVPASGLSEQVNLVLLTLVKAATGITPVVVAGLVVTTVFENFVDGLVVGNAPV